MERVFNATKKHIRSGSRNLLLLLITVALLFLGGLVLMSEELSHSSRAVR